MRLRRITDVIPGEDRALARGPGEFQRQRRNDPHLGATAGFPPPRAASRRSAGNDRIWRRESGSVLVEAMVGAAIVAITLASLYHAIIESASHNRMAEERRYALLVAQSQLASIGPIIPAVPGITEGTQGDFLWRVTIEPYGQAAQQQPQLGKVPNPVGTLCLAHIAVSYGHRPPLATLDTLILARGG